MYEKFFGFQRAPFELVPDPDFLYLGETHDSALANLVLGMQSGKGFVAVCGPVGAGKTTLLRALLRQLAAGRRVCFLNQPEAGVIDLLRAVLSGFGEPVRHIDVVDLRGRIRDLLEEQDSPGILIVDEAHLLTEDTLEQIRLLSNLEDDKRKLLQIVLSGQPELKTLLSSVRLRPLTQRIEMFYEIRALTAEETAEYIQQRLRVAGDPPGLWFEEAALAEIHRRTRGIPRLINILADRSLITAYVAETRRISLDIVAEAYRDLGAVTHAVMANLGEAETPLSVAPPPPAPGPVSTPIIPVPVTRLVPTPAPAPVAAPVPIAPPPAEVSAPRERRRRRNLERRKPTRAGGSPRGDRWMALAGLVSVALLAVVSLGGRDAGPESKTPSVVAVAAPEPKPMPVSVSVSVSTDSMATPVERLGAPLASTRGEVPPPELLADIRPTIEARVDLPPAGGAAYAVHVASFRELERARRLAETLRADADEAVRIWPSETGSGLWYRVLLGEFPTRAAGAARKDRLTESHDLSFLRIIELVHPEDLPESRLSSALARRSP